MRADAVWPRAERALDRTGRRGLGRAAVRAAAALLAMLALLLLANLFGHQLNAFFLRYPGIDKVVHVLAYLLFSVVLQRAAAGLVPDYRRRAWLVLGAGLALALVDESVQRLAPGRTVEGMDLIADLCGVTIGWVVMARPRRMLAAATCGLALTAAAYVTWSTYVRLIDYSRALQYERQHDFVRAREHYRRALASGLSSAGLFNELAWVEVESGIGDAARAVEYARTAHEMQPGSADILDTYGWALLHAGRTREALPLLNEAFRKKPGMFCIHYHLGAAYLALGDRQAAEAHFRRQLAKAGTREADFARQALREMGARP